MEINQSYKAPSIPKLSTRNISSSVLRASSSVSSATSTPKLRTSKFSFFKPKVKEDISEKLKENAETNTDNGAPNSTTTNSTTWTTKIYTTLAETNQILVEIQKQLAYDFAMRIAEEKEILKRTKAAESKRKFAAKEKAVEGVKKFGSFANNIVGKVTAPIKSVFDKIKEFFGLILTGIVTNAVFTWLEDPENRKRLNTIFDWVGKIFVGLLLAVIIGKFIKWGIRLFKLVRFFWRLPGKIKSLFNGLQRLVDLFRKGPHGGGSRGGTPLDCAGVMKCFATSVVPFLAANPRVVNQMGQSLLKDPRFLTGLATALGISTLLPGTQPVKPPQVKPPIGGGEPTPLPVPPTQSPFSKPGFDWAGFANSINQATAAGVVITGALLLSLFQSFVPAAKGGTIGELPKKKCNACSLGFSEGGTVGGKGSGLVDSVRAMLAPGEEVIKTTSSMLFRPLLKDINDNAGRLWTLFSQAVLKLIRVSDRQKEISEEFSKVIKDFDRFVQNEIDKQMMSGSKSLAEILGSGSVYLGGNDRVPTTMTNVSRSFSKPSIRSRSISSSSQSSGGGINFIPMNLPAIQTPPPQIPTPQTTATDVPIISSVNMANPYMQLTPEMYGIFV